MPARRPSTATSSASRLGSMPEAVRRGDGAPLGATSAWTSTSSGREPSSTGATTLPGAGRVVVGEERAGRVGDLDQPALGHLEHADLLGRPVAVLRRAQQAQAAGPVALDGQHHVDEVLERLRARRACRPWSRGPTSTTGMPSDLASSISRSAASRTWPTLPGGPSSSSEATVCTESTTRRPGRSARASSAIRSDAGLGDDLDRVARGPAGQPEAGGAQPDLGRGLLARRVQHLAPAATPGRDLEQERRLADARARRPAGRPSRPRARRRARDRARRCPPAAGPPRPASAAWESGTGTAPPTDARRDAGAARRGRRSPRGCSTRRTCGTGPPSAGRRRHRTGRRIDSGRGPRALPGPRRQASTGVFASVAAIDRPLPSGSRSTVIVSPWLYRPSSRCSASGSSIRFWIVRRSGRAP